MNAAGGASTMKGVRVDDDRARMRHAARASVLSAVALSVALHVGVVVGAELVRGRDAHAAEPNPSSEPVQAAWVAAGLPVEIEDERAIETVPVARSQPEAPRPATRADAPSRATAAAAAIGSDAIQTKTAAASRKREDGETERHTGGSDGPANGELVGPTGAEETTSAPSGALGGGGSSKGVGDERVAETKAPPGVAAPRAKVRIGARHDAAYLHNAPPKYPAIARRMRLEGTVIVRAWIGATGKPERVWLGRSSGTEALDEAALAAVRGWQFVPAHEDELAIAADVEVPVRFRLDGVVP
jgi:TonB family protein